MHRATRRTVLAAAVLSGLAGCLDTFDAVDAPGTVPPDADLRLEVERAGERGERVYVHNDGADTIDLRGYTLEYDDGFVYEFGRLPLEPGSWVAVESTSVVDGIDRSDPPKYVRGANRDGRFCPDGRATLVGPEGTVVGSATC